MKRVAVFPLNNHTFSIQKILSKSKKIHFSGFVSDEEPTDELRLLARSQGLDDLEMIEKNKFVEEEVDSLIVLDDHGYGDQVISNLVSEINSLNREIYIVPFIQEKYDLKNIGYINSFEELEVNEELDNIPVISIMGVGENVCKLETQIYIDSIFSEYKVLNITPKGCSLDTSFEPLPRALFSKKYSFPEKILLFRRYLSKLIENDGFDLITVSIPGSMIPEDDLTVKHYNELALVLSQAISIDINIVNIYSNFDTSYSVFQFLDNLCKYRYNSDLNMFNIVPICARYGEDVLGNAQDFYSIDSETQKEILAEQIENLKKYEYIIFTMHRDILEAPSKDFFLNTFTNNVEIL